MVIKKLVKYLKLFVMSSKFSFVLSTQYRVGFFIELLVEFGWQLAYLILLKVVFSNIKTVAGWTYYEMLFLQGAIIVFAEIFLSLVYINNLRNLPQAILSGNVDFSLARPVSSLYWHSLGLPYFTSIISTVSGFALMFYSWHSLSLTFSLGSFLSALFIFVCGLIIAFSLGVLISSLSFKFVGTKSFVDIAEQTTLAFSERPHSIYTGITKVLFFYIIPVVFCVSIPVSTMLRGPNSFLILQATVSALILSFLAFKMWNSMLKFYSSASS